MSFFISLRAFIFIALVMVGNLSQIDAQTLNIEDPSKITVSKHMQKYGVYNYFQESSSELVQEAMNGDHIAQYVLGINLLYGRDKDVKQGAKWLVQSANGSFPLAEYEIGALFLQEKKYSVALQWFSKSAEQGLDLAEYNLGLMIGRGLGVKANHEEALFWLRQAAAQGSEKASQAVYEIEHPIWSGFKNSILKKVLEELNGGVITLVMCVVFAIWWKIEEKIKQRKKG